MDAAWRIEMLGGRRVVSGDQVIERFRSRQTGLLLAYLALDSAVGRRSERTHPREALVELLWPESSPGVGRQRLNIALSFLRRHLELPRDGASMGVPTAGSARLYPEQPELLLADRHSVRLNTAVVTTDVAEF